MAKKKYRITIDVEIEEITGVIPIDPPPVDPPTVPGTKGDADKIGINTFHWVPLEKMKMFSTLRVYISSGWIWRPNGLFVEPMWQAEKPALKGFDDYFAQAKAMGIDILPCINQTPEWFRPSNSNDTSNDYPPIKENLDRTKPEFYAEYAEFCFQFVARYGSVVHPDSVLKIDTTPKYQNQPLNVKKSGLGLLNKAEFGNEFDRWWDAPGPKCMKPEEMRAMMAAVYAAVKRADPNFIVVMPGLTGPDTKYLSVLSPGTIYDVANIHLYNNSGGRANVWPPTWNVSGAVMPEDDFQFIPAKDLTKNNRDFYISEFGADTIGNGNNWMHIKGNGMSDEDAQTELLIRNYLLQIAYGVDRCYAYTAIDEPGFASGSMFQSSGILSSEQTGYKEKVSYGRIKWLIKELTGFTYSTHSILTNSISVTFMKGTEKKIFFWKRSAGEKVVLI